LTAAQNLHTSPSTLLQTELIKLVTETHLKTDHTINSNINNARTTAIVGSNTLSFIIEIPLLDNDKFFNFYSVKTIPIFHNNVTFYPDIETNNIAISAHRSKYVVLDQTELDKCMDTHSICSSHSQIQPSTKKALCVVTTYSTNFPSCPHNHLSSWTLTDITMQSFIRHREIQTFLLDVQKTMATSRTIIIKFMALAQQTFVLIVK
jgi:hypothetical protein